jgi:hypothetical protein
MKKPRIPTLLLVYIVAIVCLGAGHWRVTAAAGASASIEQAKAPRMFPDYSGIVIPPNIAPLNFKVAEPGARYRVELRSTRGDPLIITSRSASIRIPAKPWQALLRANAGEPLFCDVWVQTSPGLWNRFAPVTNFIARETIDSHLVYRRLKSQFNRFFNLGIYQRNLESFDERPLLENSKIGHQCLNCHTFLNHQPDTFALHIRDSRNKKRVSSMLLVRSNTVVRVDKAMGYLSWHPSGRLLAFSTNKVSLFYHTVNTNETRDVFDAHSHLGIYWIDSDRLVMLPAIARPDRNDNWPAWSPDGRYLYYCSAPLLPMQQFFNIRYDLMRVSFDIEHDRWGEPMVVLSAQQAGGSICQPKVSPDGRFVLFCLSHYGTLPMYDSSSELCVLDLTTHEGRRLNIHSNQSDSWHCWSGNGRWIVFSSRRLDGLFARPFFSYVDEQGQFHKPFLLPQEDPAYYDTCLQSFNVPELVQGPVTVKESDLARAVNKPRKVLTPTADSQQSLHQEQTDQDKHGDKSDYTPAQQ